MDLATSSGPTTQSAEAPQPTPPPGHGHPTACLNCGTSLTGLFCAQCGQSAHMHRFTAAHLPHELLHGVWHVDSGLPFTLKEMLVRPGHTVHRYLAGVWGCFNRSRCCCCWPARRRSSCCCCT